MIDGIGKSGAGRIELQRTGAGQGAASAAPAAGGVERRSDGVGGVAAALVALGPPIDDAKVSQVRQAIAEGRYGVDPEAIAEHMIAADVKA